MSLGASSGKEMKCWGVRFGIVSTIHPLAGFFLGEWAARFWNIHLEPLRAVSCQLRFKEP